LDRLAITQIVRKMLYDMQKNVFAKIKEIEDGRDAQKQKQVQSPVKQLIPNLAGRV